MNEHVELLPPHMTLDDLDRLLSATHNDSFSVLGLHKIKAKSWLVVLLPDAQKIEAVFGTRRVELPRLKEAVFAGQVPNSKFVYRLVATYEGGHEWEFEDPYRFANVLGDIDQHLINEGTHRTLWRVLGAHVLEIDAIKGVHFAVWAPNAARVSVIGDFNRWDGRRHSMRRMGSSGVWEIFIPGLSEGVLYKYELATTQGELIIKADPIGFGSQHPPEFASVVRDIDGYGWQDEEWMQHRSLRQQRDQPLSIYEVHLSSWRRRWMEHNRSLSYQELAEELVTYVKEMGFTHIELLPISEFPFDGSWGYQPLGLYAPTIRMGPPHEFRNLVEAAHHAGIGVILDWVPGHFPADSHGLATFDGTHLYEHADPREGFHQDWNTLIYNYGRKEVKNFLSANALYWLQEYHLDGLRVDAVASMLYRDYSRQQGEWIPNQQGGRENLEAISFLQEMNILTYGEVPGIMTIAEESTAYPGVTTPVNFDGLGFGFKWNMGWMNDTLRYMEKDPIHRSYDHHLMTFGIDYAFSENFILPISHDEVVHGKKSMLEKMPGNEWEKFANLRAYYGFMWAHPGKKLLFMGCEFAQRREWNHDAELDWSLIQQETHRGVQTLIRDLNHLYTSTPALYRQDADAQGFRWIMNNPEHSTLAFARFGLDNDAPVIAVCNFTPVERSLQRIGVPAAGFWQEIFNSDAALYAGGNRGNLGGVYSDPEPFDGFDDSICIILPPLSTLLFTLKQ